MPNTSRLTYANVVSTLALFLVLSGGVAFAASKVRAGNIAPGAVRTNAVFKRAITSGKIALSAVHSNQIADGAVSSKQIANGAVGSPQIANGAVGAQQIAAGSVAPSNLQFPVFFPASPQGGSIPVPSGGEPVAYPLTDATWAQNPGQLNVIFGAAAATLAYNGNGAGACRLFFEVSLNGRQVGGGEVSTDSTSLKQVEGSIGAQPEIDPLQPVQNKLSLRVGSNENCTPDSILSSTRFRVLDFG